MSTVPSVLNEIYVLKCDGCCNRISNMLIQYGREKKKNHQEFCRGCGGGRLLHRKLASAKLRGGGGGEPKTKPNHRGNIFLQLLIAASCLLCPCWKLSPFLLTAATGSRGGGRPGHGPAGQQELLLAPRYPELLLPGGCFPSRSRPCWESSHPHPRAVPSGS